MNLDQMLIDAGITPKGDAFTYDEINALRALVQAVEQATLERAAKHFDDRGKHADGSWSSGWYDPESPGVILRALKDSK